MPNETGKINDRERILCSRVKEFRRSLRWSQRAFSKMIGITRIQLANIECKRTPLRYEIAWWISNLFERDLAWFVGDQLPPGGLPTPRRTGLPKYALLSEVFDRFAGPPNKNSTPQQSKVPIAIDADDLLERLLILMRLKANVDTWISQLPSGCAEDFYDKVVGFSEHYLEGIPEEQAELIKARRDALLAEQKYTSLADKLVSGKNNPFLDLTESATSVNLSEVKTQLPSLRDRLNRATKETGKMSSLAEFLGVPLASVSRWLSGKREPGGEITLKLLRWVEQQERQK